MPTATASKIEALPYECPLCDVFPFATAAELGEHIARNEHVSPPTHSRFGTVVDTLDSGYETVANGHGGTTTRKAESRPVDGPTPKQIGFYRKLVDERRGTLGETLADDMLAAFESLTKRAASEAIDAVMAIARTPKPVAAAASAEPRQAIEVGMYRVGEAIYKVQKARESSNLYAKLLSGSIETGFTFEYERGAIAKVQAEGVRLSLEEAKAFGRETGTCCVCAAVLTNPESIALGIGPICGGRV